MQYLDAHIVENIDQWEDNTIIEFEANWYKSRVKDAILVRISKTNKTWIMMLPSGTSNRVRNGKKSTLLQILKHSSLVCDNPSPPEA